MTIRFRATSWLLLAFLALAPGCKERGAGAAAAPLKEIELVDGRTGRPCPGILVELWKGERLLASGSSNAAGRFTVEGVDASPARIRHRDPSGRFMRGECPLAGESSQRIALVQALRVRLRVVGDAGELLRGVRITAWVPGARALGFDLVAGEGSFGPLPAGSVKLLVAAPGRVTAVIDADLRPSRKAAPEIDLREVRLLAGGASVRGKLGRRRGEGPLEVVVLQDAAGHVGPVAPDGAFEVGGLTATSPKVLVVLRDAKTDLYAREVSLAGGSLDLGVIEP